MGLDVSTVVVCGWSAERVQVTKDQKKFNPDTGKPYTIQVPSHELLMIGEIQIADSRDVSEPSDDDDEDDDDLFDMYAGDEGDFGLISCDDDDGYVIGEITDRYDWNGSSEIEPDQVPESVKAFQAKHSLPAPSWFVITHAG